MFFKRKIEAPAYPLVVDSLQKLVVFATSDNQNFNLAEYNEALDILKRHLLANNISQLLFNRFKFVIENGKIYQQLTD